MQTHFNLFSYRQNGRHTIQNDYHWCCAGWLNIYFQLVNGESVPVKIFFTNKTIFQRLEYCHFLRYKLFARSENRSVKVWKEPTSFYNVGPDVVVLQLVYASCKLTQTTRGSINLLVTAFCGFMIRGLPYRSVSFVIDHVIILYIGYWTIDSMWCTVRKSSACYTPKWVVVILSFLSSIFVLVIIIFCILY